nr:MAG TPA: hypothetical protein [Caudoviricetes sp.]DAN91547.1 MAG TPA: hypothetical protein [Caudoviricetes sp.]
MIIFLGRFCPVFPGFLGFLDVILLQIYCK